MLLNMGTCNLILTAFEKIHILRLINRGKLQIPVGKLESSSF